MQIVSLKNLLHSYKNLACYAEMPGYPAVRYRRYAAKIRLPRYLATSYTIDLRPIDCHLKNCYRNAQ